MPTSSAERPDPCIVVIFGASGDLTARKLIPALYELHRLGALPEKHAVLGVSRTDLGDDGFREKLHGQAKKFATGFDEERWRDFASRVHYHSADAADEKDWPGVIDRIDSLAQQHSLLYGDRASPNILFYLSVSPTLYKPIIECVGAAGIVPEGKRWCAINRHALPWQRIIVEKPFGEDLESATSLNRTLGRVFDEDAIFRIDHYMGKELVQNILVMRFANTIFEPLWRSDYVDHVQITAAETVGVGARAANFYDGAGALRDMIQSHLLQVMALVAMEPPTAYDADAMARERIKVFQAVRRIDPEQAAEHAAMGRYGAGEDQSKDPAYIREKGVDPENRTDTYCALRVHVDNWRWAGTPFYLRSGKRLARKLTEVVVQFKEPPTWLFHAARSAPLPYAGAARAEAGRPPNRIVINIAPDDGISLRFEAKVPGRTFLIDSVKLDMDYAERFKAEPIEAYGPLILDAMRGDRILYKHREEVEGAWRVCQPLLDSSELRQRIETYDPGSWGPPGADELLARDGRTWHNPIISEKR